MSGFVLNKNEYFVIVSKLIPNISGLVQKLGFCFSPKHNYICPQYWIGPPGGGLLCGQDRPAVCLASGVHPLQPELQCGLAGGGGLCLRAKMDRVLENLMREGGDIALPEYVTIQREDGSSISLGPCLIQPCTSTKSGVLEVVKLVLCIH